MNSRSLLVFLKIGNDEDEYPIEAWDRQFSNQMTGYFKTTGAVRTVPVVVTVIASSSTAASNISDAQIESQFPILNAAFRGNYGGVDTEIDFCHSGTIRVVNAVLSHAQVHVNEAPPVLNDFIEVLKR